MLMPVEESVKKLGFEHFIEKVSFRRVAVELGKASVFVDASPHGYFSMGLFVCNREKWKFVFLPMNQCFAKIVTPSVEAAGKIIRASAIPAASSSARGNICPNRGRGRRWWLCSR